MSQNTQGSKPYLFSIVLVAVLGGLLFGYDTAVVSGAEKGLQAFFLSAPDFNYSDFWHGFTCSSALIGCILGSALSGVFAQGQGRKRSLCIAGVFFFLSALGSYLPEFMLFDKGEASFSLLIVFNCYRILGGVGVGLASAICPMYIAEVAPSNLRGTLVSWNQFAIIFGQLVVYFVNFVILGDHTNPVIEEIGGGMHKVVDACTAHGVCEWTVLEGWRYMFLSEAIPAGLFALLVMFIPETPRYLMMTGHETSALNVLSKINGVEKAKEILQEIKDTVTVKTEKLMTYGWVCIFVGVMLSVFQQIIGINAVLYYAPRIYGDMGFNDPMIVTVCTGVINLAFTLFAIFTVEKLGRKPLLISGSIGMAIGALGVAATFGNESLQLLCMVSIMVYAASFMFSWGPICWVYISEIFPNTIRGAAVAIAVAFQWIFNFVVSSTFVPMFNIELTPGDGFGHWFTYGMYGVICIVSAIFVWKMVPETKGKTLEEMTKFWSKK